MGYQVQDLGDPNAGGQPVVVQVGELDADYPPDGAQDAEAEQVEEGQ